MRGSAIHRLARGNMLFAYDDYGLMSDDGKRHEIIEGIHEVSSAPTPTHQIVLLNLYYVLRRHVEAKAMGTILLAPCDVLRGEHDILQPDLLFIHRRGPKLDHRPPIHRRCPRSRRRGGVAVQTRVRHPDQVEGPRPTRDCPRLDCGPPGAKSDRSHRSRRRNLRPGTDAQGRGCVRSGSLAGSTIPY